MKGFITVIFTIFSILPSSGNTIDSLKALIKNDYDTANYSVYKALHYEYLEKDLDSSFLYASLGLNQAQRKNDLLQCWKFNGRVGYVYFKKGMYQTAIEYFENSYSILLSIGDTLEAIRVASNCGITYINLGNFQKAADVLFEALEYAEKMNDAHKQSILFSNIGRLHSDQSHYSKALDYYKRSKMLCEETGDNHTLAYTLNRIGIIYKNLNEYDSAKYYYLKSYELHKELKGIQFMMSCLINLGRLSIICEDYDSFYKYYNMADQLINQNRNEFDRALLHALMGYFYFDTKLFIKAVEQYSISANFYQEEKNYRLLIGCYDKISQAYKATYNYDSALYYHELYSELKDSLFNEEKSRQIAELETIYQTEQKEKEILELKHEQERKHNQAILLAGALIFVFIVSVLFFVFYRSRRRQSEMEILTQEQKKQFGAVLQAQEEERKRIASELHDSVGQLLSLTNLYISDAVDHIKDGTDEGSVSLAKSIESLQEAIKETRTISHNLMPGALVRKGLSAACRELVRRVNDAGLLDISYNEQGIKKQPNEQIAVVYYRVLQELVNNIIKHSGATKAEVSLVRENGSLLMEVKDNGKGFDLSEAKQKGGIGLQNIFSRLELVNAFFEVDSNNKSGTTFKISLPFSN